MSKVYVIADLHFGHKKLIEIRGITDEEMVRRWNSVVTQKDVVYVLGDVFKLDCVPQLKGIKKLALGNHDQYPAARYLEHFSQVRAMYDWDNCLLTHIPVHHGQKHRWRKNVHGHTHSYKIDDPFYVCVSVEHINYTPVLLSEVTK